MRSVFLLTLVISFLALSGCSSVRNTFRDSALTTSAYENVNLGEGTVVIVLQQDSLEVKAESLEIKDVEAFRPFFMGNFRDSLLTYGVFSLASIREDQTPLPAKQEVYKTSSTKAEVFAVPDWETPISIDGEESDYIMLISELEIIADSGVPLVLENGIPGHTRQAARVFVDFVLWNNKKGELVSYGKLHGDVDKEPGFEQPLVWQKLAGHLAWLVVRRTPFERS